MPKKKKKPLLPELTLSRVAFWRRPSPDRAYSILQRVSDNDLMMEPYPHLVIHDALPPDLYAALEASYPSQESILRGAKAAPNSRIDLNARHILWNPSVDRTWRAFASYHTSGLFLQELVERFGSVFDATHPEFESQIGRPLDRCRARVRKTSLFGEVETDCNVGINTPSTQSTRVRGPHVDNPKELYAALMYFRHPDDRSEGGALELYRSNPSTLSFHGLAEVRDELVEKVASVEYRANTMVLLFNSRESIHGVSARSPSPLPRRLVNIIGETRRRMFALSPLDEMVSEPRKAA